MQKLVITLTVLGTLLCSVPSFAATQITFLLTNQTGKAIKTTAMSGFDSFTPATATISNQQEQTFTLASTTAQQTSDLSGQIKTGSMSNTITILNNCARIGMANPAGCVKNGKIACNLDPNMTLTCPGY